MIKHIVMWRLKDNLNGKNKAELAQEVKDHLETLTQTVPGLLQLEVGIHFGPVSETSYDVVLTTAFHDREALKHYDTHPEHEKVKPYVRERVSERRVVDYEI